MANSWTAVSLVNGGKEGLSLHISDDEGRGVEYRLTLQEASELRENIGRLIEEIGGWVPVQEAPARTVDRGLYLAVEKHLDDMREILFAVIEGTGVTGNRLTMVAPAAAKRKGDVLKALRQRWTWGWGIPGRRGSGASARYPTSNKRYFWGNKSG